MRVPHSHWDMAASSAIGITIKLRWTLELIQSSSSWSGAMCAHILLILSSYTTQFSHWQSNITMMMIHCCWYTFLSILQRSISSNSPGDRNRSPEAKKLKKEESDGERSDADLVVDDDNDAKVTTNGNGTNNGNRSPRENGTSGSNGDASKKDPLSPSSARSTPASSLGGKKDDKASSSPGAGKILPPVSKPTLGALGNYHFFIKRNFLARRGTPHCKAIDILRIWPSVCKLHCCCCQPHMNNSFCKYAFFNTIMYFWKTFPLLLQASVGAML